MAGRTRRYIMSEGPMGLLSTITLAQVNQQIQTEGVEWFKDRVLYRQEANGDLVEVKPVFTCRLT